MSVTSTVEPVNFVKSLTIENTGIKGFMVGKYSVLPGDLVEISMTDLARPKTIFNCVLKMSTAKHGRHTKLSWGKIVLLACNH